MGSLSFIRSDEYMDIPTPLCAQPGDVFEAIEFVHNLPTGFNVGGFVVVCLNPVLADGLFVIEHLNFLLLARLFFQTDGLRVRIEVLHSSLKSGFYKIKTVKIVGRVVEIYPTGDPSFRWIAYLPGMTYENKHALPYYSQKGPRKQ